MRIFSKYIIVTGAIPTLDLPPQARGQFENGYPSYIERLYENFRFPGYDMSFVHWIFVLRRPNDSASHGHFFQLIPPNWQCLRRTCWNRLCGEVSACETRITVENYRPGDMGGRKGP